MSTLSLHLLSATVAEGQPHDGADVPAEPGVLRLPNDADLHAVEVQQVQRIELNFPKFTDGRAFSQAWLLRRRHGFSGDIRACGDVRIDQLQQMARSGFSSAVLANAQDLALGRQLLGHFHGFYQGDALHGQPHFGSGQSPAVHAPPPSTAQP